MSAASEWVTLGPGRPNRRLLRELLRMEMCALILAAWRRGLGALFALVSAVVFVSARWPGLLRPGWMESALSAWLLITAMLAAVLALGWRIERRRRRILDRMKRSR